MSRILIAEDSPTQAEQIRFMLEDAGFDVDVAANGTEALNRMKEQVPDLVVTDLEMPEMNGLQLVEAVRRQYPGVPVILMTAFGSEEIAALALQKGATSYVPKRYLEDDIIGTVTNVLAVSQKNKPNEQVYRYLTESESRYALENDAALIAPLIAQFEQDLARLKLCDQADLIRICVALREALVNAMEHGNLEVSSEQREKDERVYYETVQQRRQEDRYRNRRVFVNERLTRQRAEFRIRDEGPGFDPSTLPDPTDPANLEKVSGRGLLLIRTFMDEVNHNETGNEITMVVRARV